jgi:precorrin-2 dehydrogenase/sirohydrochlorin ferrochelatase
VGGGAVAARKIDTLLQCGAQVRVVSPKVCRIIQDLAEQGKIDLQHREYRDSDMLDAALVFAATNNSEVQNKVAEHAAVWGIPLNSADDPANSDFHVPARISRGDLMITVSTGGASPALASVIKRKFETEFGPEYGILTQLMAIVRENVVGKDYSSEENKVLFHRILKMPVLACIKERNWGELQSLLVSVLPASINCAALISRLEREVDNQTS